MEEIHGGTLGSKAWGEWDVGLTVGKGLRQPVLHEYTQIS